MRMISVFDFRNKLADYLSSVADTERPIIVGRFGKPMAVVVPFNKKIISFDDYFGFLGKGESGGAYLRRVRRSKREKNAMKIRRGDI